MKNRQARALRDRRIDRSRRIAQSLFMVTAVSGGVGVGLMSHAAASPSTTTTPNSGGTTTTTPTPTTSGGGGKTTTSAPHTTTTSGGGGGTHQTTTTVWTPPVTVPVTHPTVCHTSASGQFLGCW